MIRLDSISTSLTTILTKYSVKTFMNVNGYDVARYNLILSRAGARNLFLWVKATSTMSIQRKPWTIVLNRFYSYW